MNRTRKINEILIRVMMFSGETKNKLNKICYILNNYKTGMITITRRLYNLAEKIFMAIIICKILLNSL